MEGLQSQVTELRSQVTELTQTVENLVNQLTAPIPQDMNQNFTTYSTSPTVNNGPPKSRCGFCTDIGHNKQKCPNYCYLCFQKTNLKTAAHGNGICPNAKKNDKKKSV